MTLVSPQTSIEDVLASILGNEAMKRNVAHLAKVPAQPAQWAEFPENLSPELAAVLRQHGYERLYTHQAEAIEKSLSGRNVAIVTPTASGKTLCYNIPVLDRLVKNPNARALYLFPTKALAQDQYLGLYEIAKAMEREIRVYTFDGDTPASARKRIREAGHIVLTNPDMLHTGILPNHTGWIALFENLETVVIDEMHQYRGVFGSHMGNVIRRLKRICKFYGSNPKFICCSATTANPKEMAERIVEEPFELIDKSGAPRGERAIVFYNPPVVNRELGIRASSVREAERLALRFIARDLQTIVFARSRTRVEILAKYLKRGMARLGRDPELIRAYRGGYLPNERREIERGIKSGEVMGVVSTNALELGVDIGSLQVSIMTGYPGSIASTWQQAGRAGRQSQTAVVILVASSAPHDQFLMNHPEYFFGASPEEGILNPDQVSIMASHLKCALHEIPFADGETYGAQYPAAFLDHFASEQIARKTGGKTYWTSAAYPAEEVSLRTSTPQNFLIHNKSDGDKILGEIDYDSAPELIHEHAIYLHQGRTFYVDTLDWERRRAYVHEIKADYYTDAVSRSDLTVLHEDLKEEPAPGAAESGSPWLSRSFGIVKVTTIVPKFKKVKFETHESVGFGEIHLPEHELQTEALWWTFREDAEEWLAKKTGGAQGADLGGALRSLGWVAHQIVAFFVMSDARDIGAAPMVRALHDGRPTLYIYDRVPGGIGLARRAFGMDRQILRAMLDVVRKCGCADGCPSCVGPMSAPGEGSRRAAALLLEGMLA